MNRIDEVSQGLGSHGVNRLADLIQSLTQLRQRLVGSFLTLGITSVLLKARMEPDASVLTSSTMSLAIPE